MSYCWNHTVYSFQTAYFFCCCCCVDSVVSNSVWPHGLPGAYQAPLSMGFSRQEYWSGLPLPSPRRHITKWKEQFKFPPSISMAWQIISFLVLNISVSGGNSLLIHLLTGGHLSGLPSFGKLCMKLMYKHLYSVFLCVWICFNLFG